MTMIGASATVNANRYPDRNKLLPRAEQGIRNGVYHFQDSFHAQPRFNRA